MLAATAGSISGVVLDLRETCQFEAMGLEMIQCRGDRNLVICGPARRASSYLKIRIIFFFKTAETPTEAIDRLN